MSDESKRKKALEGEKPPVHTIELEGVPEALALVVRWVCWSWEWNGKKWTKVPKQARFPNQNASATDPSTWCDFSIAVKASQQHDVGIGFVFNGDGIIGIDLDDCRDPETGKLCGWAQDIVDHMATYTEISPSLTGVKLYVCGELPKQFDKKYSRPDGDGAVEVFATGRFFTVTGLRQQGTPDDVRDRSAQLTGLRATLARWKPDKKPKAMETAGPKPEVRTSSNDDQGTALAALSVLDPDMGYADWLAVGMALHSIDPSGAMLDEWDRWSRGSGKYLDGECARKWASFHGGTVSIGTLCKLADDTGQRWRPIPNSVDSVNCVDSVYAPSEWGETVPLTSDVVDECPVEALPGWGGEFCRQLAIFTQTPVDMAVGMFLVACAIAVQKKFLIEPRNGWVEQLSLYLLSAMAPANRKSAVVSKISQPLKDFEKQQAEEIAPQIRSARSQAEIRLKRRIRLVDDAAKASATDRDAILHDLQQLDEEIAANPIPSEPRLLCDDITPEHLATRMSQNQGRMGVLSPEGDLFDIMGGRYSKSGQGNIGIFLKSHSGDDVRVDRGNRPSEFIESPALSLGFCVQPEVLQGLMGQKTFRGRGLLARFLYVFPMSLIGFREIEPNEIDSTVENDYLSLMDRMLKLPADCDRDENFIPQRLQLSVDAYSLFSDFRRQTEVDLGEFGSMATITDWGGKLPGMVARIAGILHIAEHIEQYPIPSVVDAGTMENAIRFGRYYVSHAMASFRIMGREESLVLASHIVKTIQKNDLRRFTVRDLHQHVRRRVDSPDELHGPLKLLEEHNHIREFFIKKPASTPGRKPSPEYESNPQLFHSDRRGF